MLQRVTLRVTIDSARGLRNAEGWASRRRSGSLRGKLKSMVTDFEGTSDPFVNCWAQNKSKLQFKTPVLTDTLTPRWGYTHTFANFDLESSLHFTVWDEDPRSLEPPGLLGRVELKPWRFYPDGFAGVLELENHDQDEILTGDVLDPPTLSIKVEVITTTTTTT